MKDFDTFEREMKDVYEQKKDEIILNYLKREDLRDIHLVNDLPRVAADMTIEILRCYHSWLTEQL